MNARKLFTIRNYNFLSRIYFKPVTNQINIKTVNVLSTKSLSTASNSSANEPNTASSIDNEEMKRFSLLSKSWWIDNGEFEALHRMNLLRVPLVRDALINYRNTCKQTEESFTSDELLREPLLGLNILDVGCGGGILSEPLARLGANVTGIDTCKDNVIASELRAQTESEKSNGMSKFYERLRYLNCSIEDLASVEENNNYFDAIVMSEVVEHVNNLDDFLVNSTKLLKNKGFSFITTINKTPQSYLLAIVGAEYVLGIVPKGTHTWEKFVSPIEIKNILEKNNVYVKFEMGMHYNPLTKLWSWSDDKSVNYAMYAQKFK